MQIFFATIANLNAQEKVTLSGTISDIETNEALIGVSLYFNEIKIGTTTNNYGFYSVTVPKGDYIITISYLGYNNIEERINLNQTQQKNFSLSYQSTGLAEVVIQANNDKTNIKRAEMSVNKLSIATVKKMPAVLGEVDVLKSILQLPGVTNAYEGATGFNVRGGSVDGNLVLLDEAIIYNTSHLFGFFSVFNSDVIKDLKLYKGGIPANYGGRTSSVLDIYQKEGNKKEFHANGGIGIVSSRLLLEGPIVKEKSSFVIAGRGTYGHLFLKLADEPNSAYFYDLNTKFNYRFNDNNNIFISAYLGYDKIRLNDQLVNDYGNSFVNLRWNHIFSDKLFSNASIIYSDYYYGLQLSFIGLDWKSQIKNYNFKYDFKHYLSNDLTLSYGINSVRYVFNPGTINPIDETSSINPDQIARKYAFENALYVSAEHILSEKLSLTYGLRYSNFQRLGEEEISTYENDQAVIFNQDFQVYEEATPTGSIYYAKNKKIASFDNFEPRFSIAYALNDDQSVKASYNRISQYIHLISNTASVSPLDIWAPSDQFLKPEIADQVALGYFKNFKNDQYSLEVETFFKTIKNKTDYIDGAELIANKNIERVMLNGKARAYGIEVLAKKNSGKLTGWLSYTLSRAEQKTPGRNALEPGINNGNWYRANYDKTHNLGLTANYQLNPKWSFGGIFTYQTGRAATFPNGKYQYQGITVANYATRNEDSLSDYHHLDISATYIPQPEKVKKWQGEWVFSIYNVYARNNAAAFNFSQNIETGQSEAKKISIFGLIPSITYNFKF
ncbi:TonB-dependent receptor [Flavobacterium ichthyis]|nr:TonB-dependent receptor [Flavobacterium ichthyis]